MTAARLRSEQGFTLVELLAGMAIAVVILLAAFDLLDTTVTVTAKTQARTEATARGRAALDTMERALRSEVCLDKDQPIVDAKWAGGTQSVTFYADFSDGSGTAPPQRHVLAYDSVAGTITDTVYTGVYQGTGNPPTAVYGTAPEVTTLATDVAPDTDFPADASGQRPVFRFYKFDGGTPPQYVGPLALPLSASDSSAITKVAIAFAVRRADAPASESPLATMQDDVYVRSADPNLTSPTPSCV
jgi:prepilin-type N-terminal cleavage/methylation domain-containing protein